ncbi:MFS transporter [Novosphingobium decolorationis]|uniref:MFS transporter n=1 Tax=Novosphingobium decolorationis TaxID=2698673 RepID=A0ABX8E3S0_9SPHN|nr:MFS transporter [Novosphingobium decolorationis]QVM83557.1 MFS transporter [Novosphingobium decolorationis]
MSAPADTRRAPEAPGRDASHADPRAAAILVAFVMFLSILEATVIATALPDMARDFGVAASELGIGITAYLMVSTAFLPLSSWVALRLGPRRVLTVSVLGFGVASLLCSQSPTLGFFVAARAFQALCSSLMTPVGNLVLLRITPKHRLVEMLAISTTPALIAPVIGPPLGGFLTEAFGWPSIFLINLPLTLVGALLARRLLPRLAPQRLRFDAVGFVLIASALSLLIYGLDRLGAHPDAPTVPLILMGTGSVLAVMAYRWLRRMRHGLVPLDALRHQTFRAISYGAGMLMRIPHMGLALVLPLYFQLAFGLSPGMAGVLLLANNLGDLAVKPFISRILRRVGFRSGLVVGTAMMMAASASVAAFTVAMPVWLMALAMFLIGMARSVPFTGMVSLAFADVEADELPGANVLNAIGNALSAAAGISLGALFLNLPLGDGLASDPLPYRVALLALSGIGTLSVFLFLRLPADAGAKVTGNAPAVTEPPVRA